MTLKIYHKKRNFKRTPEPYGKKEKTGSNLLFIVQKHAASHLHYDFRLELDGVLKSWAVPKGPSLDPHVKHLAVHVEDHPLAYGSFEGIIPAGEYGGGTVMLWDEGRWIPEGDAHAAYKKGDLTFTLKGKKLKGLWKLIRFKNDPKNWLLMKLDDKYAKPETDYNITEKKSLSVVSQKTMEQIAGAKGVKTWNSNGSEKNKKIVKEKPVTSTESFKLTHPDKILYPEGKITKFDLADYYNQIQEWMLPYVVKRPLTLVRCPSGYKKECFYQKHLNEHQQKDLYSIDIKENKKTDQYPYVKDVTGLIALVQLGVLEIHMWGCHVDKIEKPDIVVFDLDPADDVPWKRVIEAAFFVKEELEKLNLVSFVKTTGGKGLHVVVPIKRLHDWEYVSTFAKAFVDYLVQKEPTKYIGTMSKAKRKGKIFIDYLRNQRGATSIAPYSTRAKAHAPVSTPIAWDELTVKLKSDSFNINNIFERLNKLKEDPWAELLQVKQSLNFKK